MRPVRSGAERDERQPDGTGPGHTIAGVELGRVDPAVLVVLPVQLEARRGGLEEERMDDPDPALAGALVTQRLGCADQPYGIADQAGLFGDLRDRLVERLDARL